MTATVPSEIKEWVSAKFKALPETIRRHINAATYDLYFGPIDRGEHPDGDDYEYPGFCEACKQINDSLDDVADIWYNDDCGAILDSEPDYGQFMEDPDTGDQEWIEDAGTWYHYDRADLLKLIVGKELASYL